MAFGELTPDQILKNREERLINKVVDPSEAAEAAERQAERQARIAGLLAEQALVEAGDSAALARAETARAERDAAYEKSAQEQENELALQQYKDGTYFAG